MGGLENERCRRKFVEGSRGILPPPRLRRPWLGVANGPSKTSNFTGLAVSFFSGYVRLTVSIFIRSFLGLSTFCNCKVKDFEVPILFFVLINDVFSSLDTEFQ